MRGQWVANSVVKILCLGMAVTACTPPPSTGPTSANQPHPFATLDGKEPLIVAHRGLPGLHPEETAPSYLHAADEGADALEEDVHLTKDCVLVARHNPWLSDNTDVAEVAKTNPEVAKRKRVVPGVVRPAPVTTVGPKDYPIDQTDPNESKSVLQSLIVDGEDHTGDWAISDFTAEELRNWIHGTTFDAKDQRPTEENGKFPIVTLQEIIDIAKKKSAETGRKIYVYPETKNPTWNNAQALANGCPTSGGHPFEDAYLEIVNKNNLNSKEAPFIAQSFEPSSLKYLRDHGLKTLAVQLIGGHDVNYQTGQVTYDDITNSRPYDWTVAGDARWFSAMLTREGLAEIKKYADGIGPWKTQILPLSIQPFPTDPGFVGSTEQAVTATPSTLIADAHEAGLFVHPYTFRNEKNYLASNYHGDPLEEYLEFFRLGVDGVFTDFTNTAVPAREMYKKQLGH